MTISRLPPKHITEVIAATRRALSGDASVAAAETRRLARLAGPDCVAFLHYVVVTDDFASIPQRGRAASVLLETGEYLSPVATKETGLFGAADGGEAG